jgi:hypothetical protein
MAVPVVHRVFLSWSRKDVRVVRPLSHLLRGGGLFVWRDEENLEAGQVDEAPLAWSE